MHGLDETNTEMSTSTRRAHSPFEPTVEMTESGHLDRVQDVDKLVRQDSLFDYGAY